MFEIRTVQDRPVRSSLFLGSFYHYLDTSPISNDFLVCIVGNLTPYYSTILQLFVYISPFVSIDLVVHYIVREIAIYVAAAVLTVL